MADEDSPLPASLNLLDVLEQLPRHVLRQNVWLHLNEDDPHAHAPHVGDDAAESGDDAADVGDTIGRSFRLVSHRCLALADQLTRRVHLLSGQRSEFPGPHSAQGAFLTRLESPHKLHLEDRCACQNHAHPYAGCAACCACTCDVWSTLQRGGAACKSVRELSLSASRGYLPAHGHAVQLRCPRLAELHLQVSGDTLDTAFFEPLCACPALTKVNLEDHSCRPFPANLLIALADLPRLTSLDLTGEMAASDMSQLVLLTRAVHLNLQGVNITGSRRDVEGGVGRALGRLTQLTTLSLPHWLNSPSDSDTGLVLNSMVCQLSRLCSLLSLTCDAIWHTDAVPLSAAALQSLSTLTHLATAPLSPTHFNTGGLLPSLQRLDIRDMLSAVEVAATLLPLQPLRQLRAVQLRVFLRPGGAALHGGDGGEGASTVAAARTASAMLERAPHLTHVDLSLLCEEVGDNVTLFMGVIPALLLPLRSKLTTLFLQRLALPAMEVLWPIVCLATCIHTLSLEQCQVSESGLLLSVGSSLASLRRLDMFQCEGLRGASAVALAGVRVEPLSVGWYPPLHARYVRAFGLKARAGVILVSE